MSSISPTDMSDELERLKELLAKATPGQWTVHPTMAWISPLADLDMPICQMRMSTDGESCEPQALDDAVAIAAAVNFLRSHVATLSTPSPQGVERIRAEAFEEAAKLAEDEATESASEDGEIWIASRIAKAIRALSSLPLLSEGD